MREKKETGEAYRFSRLGENEVKRGCRYFFFLAATFFFAAGFLAAAFFLAAGFFAASFLAGFLAAFLIAIVNPPFPCAVAHRKKSGAELVEVWHRASAGDVNNL
jgi:fatty acid desaturase